MALLWFFWGIDIITFLAAVYFFFRAVATSPSFDPFFILGWFGLIITPYSVIIGSYWLFTYTFHVSAVLLAAVPAVPALFYACLNLLLVSFETNVSGIPIRNR
ncbi:hypothetical protein IC229_28060 [Spirosoma sp. BT702]|uniref:Uncharacterized protein n=1 Tax=Spirosoma profusum TaxID=2771354 RepID=A0A926Y0V6_9BACT|nr:hypothetical protein [Spirosoma profusum]MBD2704528.1 hypothetical protein [Spirosoma profusum]